MQLRSLERELALLVLAQISSANQTNNLNSNSLEVLLEQAIESLTQHWREGLDSAAMLLEKAQQLLLDSELCETDKESLATVRTYLKSSLYDSENVLNNLSASMEIPRLLLFSNQETIRLAVIKRVDVVLNKSSIIDSRLDDVMEGWRLKRLPRIDRDILRLAASELIYLDTPVAVACNEAVALANRYSDDQGRKMINGILRRLQTNLSLKV